MYTDEVIRRIKEQRVMPLFYNDDAAVCIAVAKALYEAGIQSIEFVNRGSRAIENFRELIKVRDISMPGMLLGAGTIKNTDEATIYINEKADFLVSPVFESSVCNIASLNKILWIPGCMTPTEIYTAQKAGCTLIKLFPGNLLEPAFVESIIPLFTGLNFMVTGGVDTTEESLTRWLQSGVVCVGLGSKLISNDILRNRDYQGLKKNAEKVIAITKSYI